MVCQISLQLLLRYDPVGGSVGQAVGDAVVQRRTGIGIPGQEHVQFHGVEGRFVLLRQLLQGADTLTEPLFISFRALGRFHEQAVDVLRRNAPIPAGAQIQPAQPVADAFIQRLLRPAALQLGDFHFQGGKAFRCIPDHVLRAVFLLIDQLHRVLGLHFGVLGEMLQ